MLDEARSGIHLPLHLPDNHQKGTNVAENHEIEGDCTERADVAAVNRLYWWHVTRESSPKSPGLAMLKTLELWHDPHVKLVPRMAD